MNCDKAEMLISELADGELPEGQAIAVRQHLGECQGCQHSYEMVLQLKSAVKATTYPEMEASFYQKLLSRLHGETRNSYVMWPLAASILMVAFLVNDFSIEDKPTGITDSSGNIPAVAISEGSVIEIPTFNACANSSPENECSIEPKYHLTEFVGV